MASMQQQARALGDPSRHQLFRYLVDADAPVGVAELTDHLGLNHNAVRQHLAKLVEAELVVETKAAPTGRGRPRLEYEVDPAVDGRWGTVSPYERLSVLLAEVLRTGDSPVEVGRRTAHRQRLGTRVQAEPVAELVDQMARHGFQPKVKERGDQVDLILEVCPFESAALTDPDSVCGLHLGLAQGIAETVEGLVIDELQPKDPRRAQCRLRCHVETADAP